MLCNTEQNGTYPSTVQRKIRTETEKKLKDEPHEGSYCSSRVSPQHSRNSYIFVKK